MTTKTRNERIIAHYQQGESATDIARRYGVSIPTVYSTLHTAGVPTHKATNGNGEPQAADPVSPLDEVEARVNTMFMQLPLHRRVQLLTHYTT